MKEIVVIGAAGRTGQSVVQYALEAGHSVTAFVHNRPVQIIHPHLTIVKGDVNDAEAIEAAIRGQDVVISTLGAKSIEGDAVDLMSDAMRIIVAAMNKYDVDRVFAVGGLGVLQHNESMQLLDKPDYPEQYKNIGEGHNKVYKVLRNTGLNWTFICCPDIIDGVRTGEYSVMKDYAPEGEFHIYTGDIAGFIVKEIEENKFLKTRIGIKNCTGV